MPSPPAPQFVSGTANTGTLIFSFVFDIALNSFGVGKTFNIGQFGLNYIATITGWTGTNINGTLVQSGVGSQALEFDMAANTVQAVDATPNAEYINQAF